MTITYAQPIQCWANRTTVSGVAVNETGWVPEVWFDWNWDDSSLGTVSRAGRTMDLGKSVGLIAAHAFKPSTFAETCGGGTNSLHSVTLTVYAVVSGARESDSATLSVCVVNPATTWPNPVAYCDDADCSNDSFTNVTEPGTPTHGGNGTDLATILNSCDATSRRILVEGGVTFSTAATSITMGGAKCLIESYGTGTAKLRSTGTGSEMILANSANCAGIIFNDVVFAGADTDIMVFGSGGSTSGCIATIDSSTSATVGERTHGVFTQSAVANEIYFFRYSHMADLGSTGELAFYMKANHTANVGGEIADSGEHHIRYPNGQYVVVDAMYFHEQVDTKHFIALRQDIAAFAFSGIAAITRNYFLGNDNGAVMVELGDDNSGALDEATKVYDVDFIDNLFAATVDSVMSQGAIFADTGACNCGEELRRVRFQRTVMDANGYGAGTIRLFVPSSGGSGISQLAFYGNINSGHGKTGSTLSIYPGPNSSIEAKNNVGYENTASTCDLFANVAESADNQCETSDPWDADGVAPGTLANFSWDDLYITSSNGALKGDGVVTAYPTDVQDEAIPQSSDYDAGVDDE